MGNIDPEDGLFISVSVSNVQGITEKRNIVLVSSGIGSTFSTDYTIDGKIKPGDSMSANVRLNGYSGSVYFKYVDSQEDENVSYSTSPVTADPGTYITACSIEWLRLGDERDDPSVSISQHATS